MFHKLLLTYFGGFIFFWFLGVDQLFFAFICTVGFFAFLATRETTPSREVIFFGLFVIATFFSVVQISSTDRYITYFRNEGVYMAMFFVIVSSTFAAARQGNATDKLYFAILIFSLQCTIVGFMASSGISLAFKSAAAYVIPDFGSAYLRGMLNKDSVQAEALWFSKGFFRPRGLMMFPNTMAGILASTMAIKAYFIYKFWRDEFKIFSLLLIAAIYMDIFSIYSSLSRSTWAGFAIALAVFPFAYKTNAAAKLLPPLIGVLVIGLVFASGLNDGIESRLVDKTHSNEGRFLNYTLIWQETTSSIDKFLFGHGTQVDHWQLHVPLGSHSTYLGVFFKFGVVGSVFFLAFLFFLYRRSLILTKSTKKLNSYGERYIRPYFLCFALITPIMQMVFIEIDVDLGYALYFAALVFLIRQETELVEEKLDRITAGDVYIEDEFDEFDDAPNDATGTSPPKKRPVKTWSKGRLKGHTP